MMKIGDGLRALVRVSGLLGTLVLTGCGLWPGGDDRYDPAPLTTYESQVQVQVVWRASPGSGMDVGFAPVVIGDAVYAATANGGVGKYELATGRTLWQVRTDVRLSAGVGSDGMITAVASPQGDVIVFDDNGKERWRNRATSEVTIPPAVGDGVVVVRSGDYRIQAFNAETGERIWSVQRPGPALTLRTSTRMVIEQGLVLTGQPGGRLLALDAATGNVQWEGVVASPKGASDLERLTDVVGSPQLVGPLLCAVAYQGRIACFDMITGGRPAWSRDFSSASGMTVAGSFAFASDVNGSVYGFALNDGGNIWKQNALRNRQLSAPAVVNATVAVGDLDGYVHFLAPQDGRLLARVSAGKGPITAPLQATPEGVLVQDGNGSLALISITSRP